MIDQMIDGLCALLRGQETLREVRFVSEFPGKRMEGPLRRPAVSIGVDGVEVEDAGIGRIAAGGALGCRAEITLGFGLYVPFSADGQALYRLLSTLTDVLLFDSDYAMRRVRCGGVTANRNTGAFTMHAAYTFQADFKRGNPNDPNTGARQSA